MTVALDRALTNLLGRQDPRGDWEGEMVWSPIITAQWVIVRCVLGRPPDPATRAGLVTHFRVTRTGDGAWGLHPESHGYVFVTSLVYVGLRLLGVGPDDPLAAEARQWLHAQPGGVLAVPTWGKLWLALLDLYDWRGVSPCPPELLLLPEWVPFHPARYYCHTRYIYIAMAYLSGRRFRADLGPLRDALRRELYAAPWEALDFRGHRHQVTPGDLHVRPAPWLRRAADVLAVYERAPVPAFRRRALARCLDRILYEQRASCFHALSPVNGLLNCLALAAADPAHPELSPSLDGLEVWRWQDEAEGVRYAGARSHAWDTAFAIQALLAHPDGAALAAEPLRRAYAFLRDTQIIEELPGRRRQGRQPSLGGWCFSDGAHRWPVSDCTAEALAAVLACHAVPGLVDGAARIPDSRLAQAAAFIAMRQNPDGGFGTYERRRGSLALERANPSEMFAACMTERSYVECTASALGALAHLRAARPDLAGRAFGEVIDRAARFLRATQRADGSWAGVWGINFTYGTFHAVRGLRAAGVGPDDPALTRAASWLVAHQRADGGWGEHWRSCLEDRYVEHPESQVVMTAWALLALADTAAASPAMKRGVAWLEARQQVDGGWPRQAVNGVFFGSAMLEYRLYASYFPVWALARTAVT